MQVSSAMGKGSPNSCSPSPGAIALVVRKQMACWIVTPFRRLQDGLLEEQNQQRFLMCSLLL
jgi:hypothetical protein